jgi:hypothetical protein
MSVKNGTPRRAKSLLDGMRDYKFDPTLARSQRIAHFLDWAARHFPKQYCPYPQLAKAVTGYARMPQYNSKEVDLIKSTMSGVNKILQTKYKRTIDTEPGIGVRATVDDADTATVALPKRMSRFKAAKNSLVATAALVDVNKIPDTNEFKPWKAWLKTSVKDVLKMVNSSDFEQKLLMPADTDFDSED